MNDAAINPKTIGSPRLSPAAPMINPYSAVHSEPTPKASVK